MLTSMTVQGTAVIKTGHLQQTPCARSYLLGGSLMAIMICRNWQCFAMLMSRQRCRLFADYNIALGILSKLSKQNDRSPTIADISRFLRQVLVSHAQRPRTNKPFPSKHLLCNELHEPFKQQSHKRSGRSLADTQRNLRSLHNEVLCDFLSIMAFTIRGMQTSVSCAVVLVHSMRNASMPVLLPCRFQRTCQSTTSGSKSASMQLDCPQSHSVESSQATNTASSSERPKRQGRRQHQCCCC